jgi:hypothetical protein
MFSDAVPVQAYIKFIIAQHLTKITPGDLSAIKDKNMAAEIAALQGIMPHAVITTNYDRFLELAFKDYQPVIGQSIIRDTPVLFGEIFKIHGCASDSNSLGFTQQDYDEFMRKKKYLSAKLLTYFSEHPLLFIGYSASDPNIRAILSDIDEAIWTCLGKVESSSEGKRSISWASRSGGSGRNLRPKPFGWLR